MFDQLVCQVGIPMSSKFMAFDRDHHSHRLQVSVMVGRTCWCSSLLKSIRGDYKHVCSIKNGSNYLFFPSGFLSFYPHVLQTGVLQSLFPSSF